MQNYIDISSLPKDERRSFFGNLSAEEKANLFKLHLALQFVKHPNLTEEQRNLILEGITMITPDAYDRENPEKLEKSRQDGRLLEQKARVLFSKREVIEIFADLGGSKTDVDILSKYQNLSRFTILQERREFFVESTPVEKSNYWKVHFALSLVKFPELTPEQKNVILDTMAFVKPEIYEVAKNTSERQLRIEKPVHKLSQRILEVFSKEIGLKVFLTLGGKTSSAENVGQCECALDSIPSCWDYICQNWSCSVTPGCGVLWLSDCNGRCPRT